MQKSKMNLGCAASISWEAVSDTQSVQNSDGERSEPMRPKSEFGCAKLCPMPARASCDWGCMKPFSSDL